MRRDGGGVVLEGLPVPPSSNAQYNSFVRGGKIIHVKTRELIAYQKAFEAWHFQNMQGVKVAQELVHGCAVEVEAFVGLSKERLFTKKGTYKRLDVSNRLKALHDCLADALGVDDSAFFSIVAEKFEVPTPQDEQVIVRLSPFKPRLLSEVQIAIL